MIRVQITGFFMAVAIHEVDFTSQAAGWINQVVEANRTGFPIARAAIEPLTDGSRKRRDLTLYDLAEDLASLAKPSCRGRSMVIQPISNCGRRARKGRSRGCRVVLHLERQRTFALTNKWCRRAWHSAYSRTVSNCKGTASSDL